jgi:hypothetical protein
MPENRMKLEQRIRGHQRDAELKTRTDRGIQNPGRRNDRDPGIALEPDELAITAIERAENLHILAEIGMPSIVNPINLPDMGRMNGN